MNEQTATPLYQTDLGQTPLPEILVTIHRYKAPGMVECRRGDELKRIYLERGDIIFASSNNVADSLGDYLLREGKITREQYDESLRRMKVTGKRHGVTLVEMGVIEPAELFASVRTHLQEIIWSIFRWESGMVGFTPGRYKNLEFVKVEIPVPQAILQGVRRMPDARVLVARLGTKATVLERTATPLDGITLTADEQNVLSAVDGRKPLVDLVNVAPLSSAENARILYGLFALQLIAAKSTRPIKVQVKTDGGSLTS